MLKKLRSSTLLRGFSVYFGTSVANRALPFLLLPVLTAYLTPEEYGLMSLYQAVLAVATPILGMNMGVNITRIFFTRPKEEIAQTITAILSILALTSITITIGLLAFAWVRG